MNIIDANLGFLKRLHVKVSGSWQEGEVRKWKGCAISSEPLVAVVFCIVKNKVEWCKSERGNPDGQPMSLYFGPHDNQNLDVAVNFSVGGGGVRSRCLTSSKTYMPEIEIQREIITGEIEKIFTVEGSNIIELYSLFIAASDVKVGRNGLWNIREEYRSKLSSPLYEVLTFGRTGEVRDT